MPAFHGPALARYVTTIDTITQSYLQRWEAKREFVWFDEFKQLTFDIASQIFWARLLVKILPASANYLLT